MPTPRIHLTIDAPLLASPSRDTLVLSRKVNGVFNTALAVASINPPQQSPSPSPSASAFFSPSSSSPFPSSRAASPSGSGSGSGTAATNMLYSQNIFAWDNTFRVAVSHHATNSGGALAASLTNAVEVRHGETVRFSRNMLMPATREGGEEEGVAVGLRDLSLMGNGGSAGRVGSSGGGGGGGGGCCVFSVADVPPSCRVEVMQVVGGGAQGRLCRVWQGEEGGLGRVMEVRVSDEVSILSRQLL